MKKFMPRRSRRISNTLTTGYNGAGTTNDFNATQVTGWSSLSPYYSNNFLYKYQVYANLYETSWEARKIIDIPVDDAMRKPTIIEGLPLAVEQRVRDTWEAMAVDRQLRRAMKQERLLGGAVLLAIMELQNGEKLDTPLNNKNILQGDFKALNVVDVSKLSRTRTHWNPFAEDYDRIASLSIDGVEVDASRMVVFDGNSLFGRNTQRILQNFRYNPLGFGESKLAPLYDTIIRALGTQQAAFQLISRASSLVLMVNNLRDLKALDGNSGAEAALVEMGRQLSIYNNAVVSGKDIQFENISASFGSVPELLLSYMQFIAAGYDIPISRFMGEAAKGLNASGEGDSRNYYDMVDSIISQTRKPAERKILDWIGISLYGYSAWKTLSKELTLDYEPLWNLDAVQQATRDEIIVRMIVSMYQAQMISAESAIAELKARELFETDMEAEQALMQPALDESGLMDGKNGYPDYGQNDQKPQTEPTA